MYKKRISLFIVTTIICSQLVFKGTSADYAPEKMGLDDEARQEMFLEPRSSIPHPKDAAPEPQVATARPEPLEQKSDAYEIDEDNSGSSGKEINEEDDSKGGEAIVESNGFNQTSFNEEENSASKTAVSNESAASSFSQETNERPASKEVSEVNVQNSPSEQKQENISAPQSISFGMPSKPLTPIKPIEDVQKVVEESKTDVDENSQQENIAFDQQANPTVNKVQQINSNTDAADATGNNTKSEPADTQAPYKAYNDVRDSGFSKEDMEMQSGSGSNDQEEPNANDALNKKTSQFETTAEKADENNDEDEEDDGDFSSGSAAGSGAVTLSEEDHPSASLHKNHTLSSTNGPLKLYAHNENAMKENLQELKQHYHASSTEDAFTHDKEENEDEEEHEESDDKEKMINQEDQPKTPEQEEAEMNLKKIEDSDQETHTMHTTNKDENASLKIPEATLNHKHEVHTSKSEDKTKVKHHQNEVKISKMKVKKTIKHFNVKPEKTEKVHIKPHPAVKQDKKPLKPKKPLYKYINYKANLHSKTHSKLIPPHPQTCNSDEIKTGFSLKGGTRAGHVESLGGTPSMPECIKRCCHKDVCDVALLLDGRCFGVACYSKELCEPIPVPHPHYVASQIAFLNQPQRRGEVERAKPEFDCKYGELTVRNNHHWTGELCGGVVSCKNGIITVSKCSGIPPRPKNCANPKLYVKQKPGHCCIKKWKCQDKSCWYGGRKIPHGVSLSDSLCTGVVSCMNGLVKVKHCPGIPSKPTNCANPRLKIITKPGKCCKRKWVCQDKSCSYKNLKVDHGERLTDASCAVVMECNNGFLSFKDCPGPPPIPHGCLNPTLKVQRVLGECCNMKWACAPDI